MYYDTEAKRWVNALPGMAAARRICRHCGNPVKHASPGAMDPSACCPARARQDREERIERARAEGRLA